MQTILGANGIIGEELARELKLKFTSDIRLVGRNPKKVNTTDKLFVADLLDPDQAVEAVKGSEIAFLTVGLPYKSEVWQTNWAIIMRNTIDACKKHSCKLVYFDNTYMYGQTDQLITESEPFHPTGTKGIAKAETANMLLTEMKNKSLEAVICRAPEFYGPGKTKSITNLVIFNNIRQGKKLKVLLRDDKKRTLIYAPDAARAMALVGNTEDAYGQTWHLPCDDNRLTYKEFITLAAELYGKPLEYVVLKKWMLKILSLFSSNLKETRELFPRYEVDNLFDSSKFKTRFPGFEVTTYREGIQNMLDEIKA